MDRSSSLGVEIAFVWWGPTFVMLCFAAVAALARLWGLAACGGKGAGGGEGTCVIHQQFLTRALASHADCVAHRLGFLLLSAEPSICSLCCEWRCNLPAGLCSGETLKIEETG